MISLSEKEPVNGHGLTSTIFTKFCYFSSNSENLIEAK